MHRLSLQELPYDPNQVTPGWIGFTVMALIAGAVILLLLDFNRRVRRINDRADARERLEAEVAAAQGEPAQPRPTEDGPALETGIDPGAPPQR